MRWMGEELAAAVALTPEAMRAPASSPKMAAKRPSMPGAVPSTRDPRGFRGSKEDLDVYRRRHVPLISSRVAGEERPPMISSAVMASAMARSSEADAPAPRPRTPRRRDTNRASASDAADEKSDDGGEGEDEDEEDEEDDEDDDIIITRG